MDDSYYDEDFEYDAPKYMDFNKLTHNVNESSNSMASDWFETEEAQKLELMSPIASAMHKSKAWSSPFALPLIKNHESDDESDDCEKQQQQQQQQQEVKKQQQQKQKEEEEEEEEGLIYKDTNNHNGNNILHKLYEQATDFKSQYSIEPSFHEINHQNEKYQGGDFNFSQSFIVHTNTDKIDHTINGTNLHQHQHQHLHQHQHQHHKKMINQCKTNANSMKKKKNVGNPFGTTRKPPGIVHQYKSSKQYHPQLNHQEQREGNQNIHGNVSNVVSIPISPKLRNKTFLKNQVKDTQNCSTKERPKNYKETLHGIQKKKNMLKIRMDIASKHGHTHLGKYHYAFANAVKETQQQMAKQQKGKQADTTSCSIWKQKLTIPKPFNLSTQHRGKIKMNEWDGHGVNMTQKQSKKQVLHKADKENYENRAPTVPVSPFLNTKARSKLKQTLLDCTGHQNQTILPKSKPISAYTSGNAIGLKPRKPAAAAGVNATGIFDVGNCLTETKEFELKTEIRGKHYKEQWQRKIDEEEKRARDMREFKAKPISYAVSEPPLALRTVKPSNCNLTRFEEFDLKSERRAVARREFEEKMKIKMKEMEQERVQMEIERQRQEEQAILQLRRNIEKRLKAKPLPSFYRALKQNISQFNHSKICKLSIPPAAGISKQHKIASLRSIR